MTQQVFLDFDSETGAGDYVYTTADRTEILNNIAADFSDFDFTFHLTQPSGDYSTIVFNAGSTGGLAEKIDFRNQDKNDMATVNVNGLTGDPVELSSFIASHELGHLQGLRHGDSFGAIENGLPSTGTPGNIDYRPDYPGPATSDETTGHIMASPGSVGQAIAEANSSAFFSERSAVKLAFNENGTIVAESEPNNSIATAQAIVFAPLNVPNTLESGDNAGLNFEVKALAVTGSLASQGDEDFYSFTGNAGEVYQFEVLSNVIATALDPNDMMDPLSSPPVEIDPDEVKGDKPAEIATIDPFGSPAIPEELLRATNGGTAFVTNSIDPEISVFDSSGNLVTYFTSTAFNDDEFESFDSILIDFELPVNDTYTIKVNAFRTTDTGEYELFGYQFTECFVTGTRILTDKGEIVVEDLEIGDRVQTAEGKLEPIKWIGRQTIKPNQVQNPLRCYPILIKAGALGNNLPSRDLYVSPDHSMFVEGLLINAGALVNDISILKTEPTETFTYYHVELENHSLLVAEGTAAESYLPQKENREVYDNCAEYEKLYPHGSNLMLWPMDYPRISSWNKVPRFVRKKLRTIADQITDESIKQRA